MMTSIEEEIKWHRLSDLLLWSVYLNEKDGDGEINKWLCSIYIDISKPEKNIYKRRITHVWPFSCSFAPHEAVFIFYDLDYYITRAS